MIIVSIVIINIFRRINNFSVNSYLFWLAAFLCSTAFFWCCSFLHFSANTLLGFSSTKQHCFKWMINFSLFHDSDEKAINQIHIMSIQINIFVPGPSGNFSAAASYSSCRLSIKREDYKSLGSIGPSLQQFLMQSAWTSSANVGLTNPVTYGSSQCSMQRVRCQKPFGTEWIAFWAPKTNNKNVLKSCTKKWKLEAIWHNIYSILSTKNSSVNSSRRPSVALAFGQIFLQCICIWII